MINAAIVGMGWWGQVLVKSVQGVSDKLRFNKGATRTPENAAAFADEQGIELVDSYEALLRDDSVDAVVLATPHSVHAKQVEAAAAAGKHVFCEKPVALFANEAQSACEATLRHGVVLAVGYNRRFHPAFQEMRSRVSDGRLGNILHVEGNFSSPGLWRYPPGGWRVDRNECPAGGLAPMGIHIVDAIISMFGRVQSVYAQSSRLYRTEGLDEMTSALMRMQSGVTAYMGTSPATQLMFDFRVFGEAGWAEIRNIEMDSFVFSPREGEREEISFEPFDSVRAEIEAFADAIDGRADYPVPLDEVVHGTAVLRAMVDSAESGAPVTLE